MGMKMPRYNTLELQELNNKSIVDAAYLVKLQAQVSEFDYKLAMLKWEYEGKLKSADESFAKYGRMCEMYRDIEKENKYLKGQIVKKELIIEKQKGIINKFIAWRKKQKIKLIEKIERRFKKIA